MVAKPRVNTSGKIARELVRSRVKFLQLTTSLVEGRKRPYIQAPSRGLDAHENKTADPPQKTTRSRTLQLRRLPHGKISLTPDHDSSLNMALLLSNDV